MTRYYLVDEKFIRSPLKKTSQIFGIESKLDKANSLHFKEKNVLIDFLLYVYIQILENKLQESITHNKFCFEILKKQHRLVLFSEEKFFSVALPFDVLLGNSGNFYLKSQKYKEEITIESLRILKILFDRIIIEGLSLSLLDYVEVVDDIYKDYCEDNGMITTSEDSVEKLLLELLEYDSSYIRFDIDFENCCDNGEMTAERINVHPPYHFDTGFRDSVSFKIGLDTQLSEEEFKNIFLEDKDCLFIKKGYKPSILQFRRK